MGPKSWEEQLTDAYWSDRWRKIMEPLCETFQRWKAGELAHEDVNAAVDEAYKEKCLINNLVTYRPDRAAAVIQWWDREWFLAWIEENRPPPHVKLEDVPPESSE
jgi:hypothetical protein